MVNPISSAASAAQFHVDPPATIAGPQGADGDASSSGSEMEKLMKALVAAQKELLEVSMSNLPEKEKKLALKAIQTKIQMIQQRITQLMKEQAEGKREEGGSGISTEPVVPVDRVSIGQPGGPPLFQDAVYHRPGSNAAPARQEEPQAPEPAEPAQAAPEASAPAIPAPPASS